MDRRSFLRLTAAGAVSGSLGLSALSACTTKTSQTAAAAGVALPTHVAAAIPKPDLPGNQAGLRDAYLRYPENLVHSVKETPGKGGEVTGLLITYVQPPPPLAQNRYWQELNRRLGVSYKPVITSEADFRTKLNAVVAGGDLPDLMLLYGASGQRSSGAIPHQLDFLQSKCQDLTEYLSGDAVKQYPNLANLSTHAWRNTLMGGRLYGLPQDRGVFDAGLFIHQNLADQAGISQPRNADEFRRLMKELNRPAQGFWAMSAAASSNYNLGTFQQIFGAPNRWAVDGSGKFSSEFESAATKEAVAFARQLFQDGVYHPDANNMSTSQCKTGFYGGKFAAYQDGFSAYQSTWEKVSVIRPDLKPRVMVPFGHDGGRGRYFFGAGSFGVTVMKKASKNRVQELLRIADYLAAPFGSEEAFFLTNGIKDVDYALDEAGNPKQTNTGQQENTMVQGYITSGPWIVADPAYPEYVRTVHQQETQLVPLGIDDPTIGLYSETYSSQAAALLTLRNDRLSAIISGRAPMSDYDAFVSDWRSQGGDAIRKEYQQAYAKARK